MLKEASQQSKLGSGHQSQLCVQWLIGRWTLQGDELAFKSTSTTLTVLSQANSLQLNILVFLTLNGINN